MDWERLIIWVMRYDGHLETARSWYRMAKECGAVLDEEKLRAVAKEVCK